jgi:hypothetical protein
MTESVDLWGQFAISVNPEPDREGTYRVTFAPVSRHAEHSRLEHGPPHETRVNIEVLVHLYGPEAVVEWHKPTDPVTGLKRNDFEARAVEMVRGETALAPPGPRPTLAS